MSIPSAFASHQEARRAGWFSRRHQTDEAHRAAQEAWRAQQQEKADREAQQHADTLAYRQRRNPL